jgi:hypothetical protein
LKDLNNYFDKKLTMKEIITEINKRSEYLKPDKKFTKNLRNQVLAHSKTTQKAKSNFWAIV